MYSSLNKRFVKIGSALTLLSAVIAVVVANTYPFVAGDVWLNSMVLTIVPCIGIWAAVIVFIVNDEAKELLEWLGMLSLIEVVIGAMVVYIFTYLLDDSWSPLLWGAYGVNVLAHIIAPVVIYLLTPVDELEQRRIRNQMAA